MAEHTTTYEEFKKAHYKKRGERVKIAMKELAESGRLPGPVPLGYLKRRNYDGILIEIDETVAPHIRKAFLLASGDMPLRKILIELTQDGLRSKRGNPLDVSTLWFVLTNPYYMGKIRHNGELSPGQHRSIVSDAEFDMAREGLFKRKKLLDKATILQTKSKP